ncbi:LOW QUALITY PROTEIN: hypothetical protein BC936DRAFT_148522 [Jimgerdemannia flammicorona]|uniref:SWR1-complex protein 4 n=1 Tax=Jimgerdemannia flammicorona TaxID=994334 RepID=A0A433D2X2_9FUNG|nr:LOW QUALITY PROTEIN: hypothetical protein BC936DRAFT_148522 [Jimgerdemannia flammicorona]
MNGNDIRDILQITKPSESAKKLKQPESQRKPDGISRELFSLIGGAPPLSLVKPAYKAKPILKKKAVTNDFNPSNLCPSHPARIFTFILSTPRVWHAFTNPARDDNLILHHWVKGSEDDAEEYRFAKFNKVIDVVEYNDEEYIKHLNDPQWTREETDYLFDLCRRFDLRFVVIADRYDFGNKTRSMEVGGRYDIHRYYDVNRKLLKARSPTPGEISQERMALIHQYSYDKARETERKKNLSILFNRTPEQIEEEEALYIESRRIEQNEKKLAKEREGLLKFLQTHDIMQTGPLPSPGLGGMGPGGQSGVATPGTINIAGGSGMVSPMGLDKVGVFLFGRVFFLVEYTPVSLKKEENQQVRVDNPDNRGAWYWPTELRRVQQQESSSILERVREF